MILFLPLCGVYNITKPFFLAATTLLISRSRFP